MPCGNTHDGWTLLDFCDRPKPPKETNALLKYNLIFEFDFELANREEKEWDSCWGKDKIYQRKMKSKWVRRAFLSYRSARYAASFAGS